MFFIKKQKKPLIELPEGADFYDEIFIYGKKIYDTIMGIVKDNENGDKDYYNNATILVGGCIASIPLNKRFPNLEFYINCPDSDTIINFTFRFNNPKPGMGFGILYSNFPTPQITPVSFGSLKNPFTSLDACEKDFIRKSMLEAVPIAEQARYLKGSTQISWNYNENGRAKYFTKAMEYIQQIDPERKVLPAVEYAVNKVAKCSIFSESEYKDKVDSFKTILTQKVMEELKKGNQASISTGQHLMPVGILRLALHEAGMDGLKLVLDNITVDIDAVEITELPRGISYWNDNTLLDFPVFNSEESTKSKAEYVKNSNPNIISE